MRPRRPERGDSPIVLAALLGVLLGSSASLWVQRSNAAHVCSPADCMTCPVCAGGSAVASGVTAVAASYPVGGTWRPAEREGSGNAELQAVLKRVAINDEVLVAGASEASHGGAAPLPNADRDAGARSVKQRADHSRRHLRHAGHVGRERAAHWRQKLHGHRHGRAHRCAHAAYACRPAAACRCKRGVALTPPCAARAAAGAMEKIGVAYWQAKAADLADKAQDNHGISAQKFHLLREFLLLGYRVLLSGAAGGQCAQLAGAHAVVRSRRRHRHATEPV